MARASTPEQRLRRGRAAERLVRRRYERDLGFTVLGMNVRVGMDELDLIVCRGDVIRFVEVRSSIRRRPDDLAWTLIGRKVSHLRRAIQRWWLENREHHQKIATIDVAFVFWATDDRAQLEIWPMSLSICSTS
tara:strand:+ start:2270 stop:2668 length:399 start_codon:yes stop_codon:yes gene_type:complete